MTNLGIIGAGMVMQAAHVPALQSRGDVRVVRVADPSERLRAAVGERLGCDRLSADYREVLEDPRVQAVDVCLPHNLHEPVVLDAFAAGKDVVLEKPIAATLAQADRMIGAARAAGRRFFCALNQRFYPPHRRLKDMVASGEHGRPFLALFQVVGDELERMSDPASWKGSWDLAGGGALMDTGTHVVDLALWWFGRPRTVSCQWGRFVVPTAGKADDNVAVTFGYDAMLVQLCVSYACRSEPWRETKWVYFPGASVHVTGDPNAPMLVGRDRQPPVPLAVEPMHPWWEGSVAAGLNHWLDCLQGAAEPAFGPEAAREALEVILAAYRSAAERRTIELPLTPPR